jgi:hypothetical protein
MLLPMNEILKSKINNAFDTSTIVGNTVFSADEFNEMLAITKQIIKIASYSVITLPTPIQKRILFATLVEIAKRRDSSFLEESNDEGFWEHVFFNLGVKYNKSDNLLITECIRSLSMIHATNKKKFYGTVLMHALAPEKSLFAFFDLCYNIYKFDLEFNYTHEDTSFIKYCAERFSEIIKYGKQGENEDISVGSYVYSIKIGLRQMSINMSDQFYYIIEKTIRTINHLFHNPRFRVDQIEYIDVKINEWWHSKDNLVSIDRKSSRNITRAVSKKNIEVVYMLENNEVFLLIPPIRLESDSKVVLEIYRNEKVIYNETLWTKRNAFITTTAQKKLRLQDIVDDNLSIKLNVVISADKDVIYKSGDKLNRQFILFGNELEISKTINTPNNYFLYSYDQALIDNINQKGIIKSQVADHLFNIYPQSGDSINGFKRTIIFIDSKKNRANQDVEVIGALAYVEWIYTDKYYQVFTSNVQLLINNETSLNGLVLHIDSQRIVISDLSDYHLDDDSKFRILDLSQYISKEKPVHLSIYSYLYKKEMLSIDFILFRNLKIQFGDPICYLGKKNFIEIDYDSAKIKTAFGIEKDELKVDFQNGILVISVPWMKWRIDYGDWNRSSINAVQWFKEALPSNGSILEIELPTPYLIDDYHLCYFFGSTKKLQGPIEISGKNGKYSLGALVYSISQYEAIFFMLYNKNAMFELLVLSTLEHFQSQPVIYSSNTLKWCPQRSFIGEKEHRFTLRLHNESSNFLIENLTMTNQTIDIVHIPKDLYQLSITMFSTNLFLSSKQEIYECEYRVGTKEELRLKGKEIIIQEVYCGNETPDKSIIFEQLIPTYFIDNLEYINVDGRDYYLGSFGVFTLEGKKRHLNRMENSRQVFEQINPVRIEFITNDIIYLLAGYNINDPDDYLGLLFYNRDKKYIDNQENKKKPNCVNAYKVTIRRKT